MTERPILFSAPMVRALLEGRKTQTRRIVKKVLPVGAVDPERYWGPLKSECIMDHDYLPSSLECIQDDCVSTINGKLVGTDLCPYGEPCDRLWVKETWTGTWAVGLSDMHLCFAADGSERFVGAPIDYVLPKAAEKPQNWVTPLFMPRWASRITLDIAQVRVERLQDISEEDAIAEGLSCVTKDGSLYKYGIPDRDCLPGTDDDGWPWAEWDIDPRMAYFKLWNKINGKGAAQLNPWVWAITFPAVSA